MVYEVYSKNGCPFCEKIKAVLTHKSLDHTIKVLDVDFNREEFYEKFGQGSTFPQVILNGEKLGGCVDTVKYLRSRGLV